MNFTEPEELSLIFDELLSDLGYQLTLVTLLFIFIDFNIDDGWLEPTGENCSAAFSFFLT